MWAQAGDESDTECSEEEEEMAKSGFQDPPTRNGSMWAQAEDVSDTECLEEEEKARSRFQHPDSGNVEGRDGRRDEMARSSPSSPAALLSKSSMRRTSKPRNPNPETRNPQLETPNPKPETRNPKLGSQNPELETRNPKPGPWTPTLIGFAVQSFAKNRSYEVPPKPETRSLETGLRNPKPGSRNPKPETRNPKPGSRTRVADFALLCRRLLVSAHVRGSSACPSADALG